MTSSAGLPIPQSDHWLKSWSMLASAPGPFVQGGDALRLRATTTDATGTLTCAYRMLTKANDDIVTGSFDMTFSGTGTQTAVVKPVAEGWLIGLWVGITSGTITDSEVQASVDIVQNVGATAFPVMSLCSGEITNVRSLGLGAFDVGLGTVVVTDPTTTSGQLSAPSAGSEWTITVTAGQQWKMLAFSSSMVAGDATSREFYIEITDGTDILCWLPTGITVAAASGTRFIHGALNGARLINATSAAVTVPLPDMWLQPGWTIGSFVSVIEPADQWSAVDYAYEYKSA